MCYTFLTGTALQDTLKRKRGSQNGLNNYLRKQHLWQNVYEILLVMVISWWDDSRLESQGYCWIVRMEGWTNYGIAEWDAVEVRFKYYFCTLATWVISDSSHTHTHEHIQTMLWRWVRITTKFQTFKVPRITALSLAVITVNNSNTPIRFHHHSRPSLVPETCCNSVPEFQC